MPGAPRATVAIGLSDGPTAVIGLEDKRTTDGLVAALASRITATPDGAIFGCADCAQQAGGGGLADRA